MIKYHTHTIMEVTNIQTNEKLYELGYWYVSSDAPQTAAKRIDGYFKTREEAEARHNQKLVNGLLKDE